MHPVIRLVNRNLTIALNPGFLTWQIIFPLIYIFIAGYAYTSLIDTVPFFGKNISYPAFLATGMIGFNIMNSTLISGIIIWTDKRNGMFAQILSGPFTKTHYILANVTTIGIVGMGSALLIGVIALPVFAESIVLDTFSIPILIFVTITGSITFGSIATMISTKLKTSEGFNIIINTVFLFFAFVSTAFYPAQGAPEPLATLFYLNPLTHVVDVIRAGLFNSITEFTIIQMIILAALAITCFTLALQLLRKMDF